jgi:hypothetical protein
MLEQIEGWGVLPQPEHLSDRALAGEVHPSRSSLWSVRATVRSCHIYGFSESGCIYGFSGCFLQRWMAVLLPLAMRWG